MKITEPMTMATDYMIAIEASIFAFLLFQDNGNPWSIAYFAFLGAGSILGGTSHGFKDYLSSKMESAIWKGTLVMIGLTSYTLVIVITMEWFGRGLTVVSGLFLVGLIWYFTKIKSRGLFLDAIVYYGVSMCYILLLTSISYIIDPTVGKQHIIASVIILGVATAIQAKKVSLHRNFNHNDLFHVISMVAFWFLYKGLAVI